MEAGNDYEDDAPPLLVNVNDGEAVIDDRPLTKVPISIVTGEMALLVLLDDG